MDVLVNNAGLGEAELFETSPWSRMQQILAVNSSKPMPADAPVIRALLFSAKMEAINSSTQIGFPRSDDPDARADAPFVISGWAAGEIRIKSSWERGIIEGNLVGDFVPRSWAIQKLTERGRTVVGCWGLRLTPPDFGNIVPVAFTPVLGKHTKSFNVDDTLSLVSSLAHLV